VRVVHHDERAIALGKLHDGVEGRHIAIHGEHPVGRDQPMPGTLRLAQFRLEVGHVPIRVAHTGGLAQPYAVDDARMIELVGDDGVVRAEQRLEQTTVRVEAGAVQDRVFSSEKMRDTAFEFLVDFGGAADEAYRGHAEPPAIKSLLRGGDHGWVISKPEIVIGAEIDQCLIIDADPSGLRRTDHCLGFEEAFTLQRGKIISELILESAVHDPSYSSQLMITFPPRPEPAAAKACSYSV
jgi:hypothetical protein